MKPRRVQAGLRKHGFSLVEVLVACAVLTIILLLTAQFISDTTRVIQRDKQRMDAFSAARAVIDRLSTDWSSRARVSSAAPQYVKQTGDDTLTLYSQTPAYVGGDRATLSQVGYRMGDHSDYGRALERAAVGSNWFGGQAPVQFPAAGNPPVSNNEYGAIGQGILRFELAFLTFNPTNGAWTWRANTPAVGASDQLRGVGVFLVTLDGSTLNTIPEAQRAAALIQLGRQFPDAVDGINPAQQWESIALNPQGLASAASVPLPVAQSVKVFQRLLTSE